MQLATRCPYCQTTFRVVQDQLKICNGIVRCGACRQVFNGIEQLQSADVVLQAERARAENEATWPASAEANPNPMTIVAQEDTFTEAHDDLKLILAPAEDAPEDTATSLIETPDPISIEKNEPALPAPEEDANPDLMLRVEDDRREPQLAPDGDHDTLGTPAMAVAPAAMEPEEDDPAYTVEIGLRQPQAEPEFMRRARQQERYGRISRIVMALLVLGMLPALFLQLVDVFHQQIGAALPKSKPLLAQVCGVIECQTALPAHIDSVSVDASELQASTGGDKIFTLNLLMRNRSAMAQAWPLVELTLNDAAEKPIARRVLSAADYLTSGQDLSMGIAAKSEHSLQIALEVDDLKPVGYRVYIFYP